MSCMCGDAECPSCGSAQGTLTEQQGDGLCGCERPEAEEPHTCPFKSEINDDETLCRCCESCTEECADEI